MTRALAVLPAPVVLVPAARLRRTTPLTPAPGGGWNAAMATGIAEGLGR